MIPPLPPTPTRGPLRVTRYHHWQAFYQTSQAALRAVSAVLELAVPV